MREQTLDKLYGMKLNGMAEAYEEQQRQAEPAELSFEERFAMLVERQWIWKENRALATRMRFAGFKLQASMEEVNYRHPRELNRRLMDELAANQWIRRGRACLISGATGLGKTWLACALGHHACRDGYRVLYAYAPKFFRELSQAQVDGSLTRYLKKLAGVDLLIVDDFGLEKARSDQYRLFLEVLDDRKGANLITSQYPVDTWHDLIGDPTAADAILDRLVHHAYVIALKGESMRKEGQNT